MQKTCRIELNELNLGQLLDGLGTRAEAQEKTTNYHRTGEPTDDFIVEECNDADEAAGIASRYRSIIATIREQREAHP